MLRRAPIDAEIERLKHARLLIAQSGFEKPSNISRWGAFELQK